MVYLHTIERLENLLSMKNFEITIKGVLYDCFQGKIQTNAYLKFRNITAFTRSFNHS